MKNEDQKNAKREPLYDIMTPEDLVGEQLGGWMRQADYDADTEAGTFRIGEWIFDARTWAEGAEPHWLTPPMRDEDREALVASIGEQGVLDCITISHTGEIVDGYHRLTAWLTLVLAGHPLQPPPFRLVRFESVGNEKRFVLAQNVARRHLSTQEKEDVLRQLLRDGHPGTDPWLSKIVGLHAETVKEIRATLENLPSADGGIEFQEKRVSENGKKYAQKRADPATQKRRQETKVIDKKKPPTKAPSHELKEPKKPAPEGVNSPKIKDEEAAFTGEGVVGDSYQAEQSVVKEPCPYDLPEEVEVDNGLMALIEDWWREFQFLPVVSKELAELERRRTGQQEDSGDATRMTLRLRSKVGHVIGGHLILYRRMSNAANLALFMLTPALSMSCQDLDWRMLTDKAGKIGDQKEKNKAA
ncbi:hypothetical protein GC173_10545 [bacterium]|nr:hypothetical protein [bacterium]